MQMRDLSGIPGVAQPKTAAQTDDITRKRAQDDVASMAGFANPVENILAIGLQNCMKVADFGAGSGAYTLAAARTVGTNGKVYAVEVQKDLLTRIKNTASQQHLENIEIIWGDFELPHGSRVANCLVDVVIISNALFQLENKSGALHEARRILKPAGKLAIIDWSESFSGMGPPKNDVVQKEAALELARMAGFTLMNEFDAGAHHYGLLLRPVA